MYSAQGDMAARAQKAARDLGLDLPYTVKVVGGRIELITPWQSFQEPPQTVDPAELPKMSRAELGRLARLLNAPVKAKASKADLTAAIRELLECQYR